MRDTRTIVMLIAVSMFAAGAAVAIPNEPGTPGIDPDGSPFVGPDVVDQCNDGVTSPYPAQELGYGGDAYGTALANGGAGSGYHRYANDNAIGGLDACLGLGGVPLFAACAVGTESQAVADAIAAISPIPPPPTTGELSAAATILTSATGGVVAGACGGIGGSGTDGEFEYGSDAAFLNVRTTSTANGGDGLAGCYGPDQAIAGTNCGSTAGFGCLEDAFVSATAHHAADTRIFVSSVYVMNDVTDGNIGFTVGSDWSRDAATSSSGQDLNKINGAHHCGDGNLEPCNFNAAAGFGTRNNNFGTAHAGLVNDARQGNTGALTADMTWLAANTPLTSAQLEEWNQYRTGCNPLDFTDYQPSAGLSSLVNVYDNGAALSGFGKAGYTGSASGYLLVFIDDPTSAGIDPWDLTVPSVTPHDLVTASTVGWVWTGSVTLPALPSVGPTTQGGDGSAVPACAGGNSPDYLGAVVVTVVAGVGRTMGTATVSPPATITPLAPVNNVYRWEVRVPPGLTCYPVTFSVTTGIAGGFSGTPEALSASWDQIIW